jgi:hypothetical protein
MEIKVDFVRVVMIHETQSKHRKPIKEIMKMDTLLISL